MNERIKAIRTAVHENQTDFAKALSVSRSAICKMESGENSPSEQTIKLICQEFNVNENWLRNGTGEMFVKLSPDEQIAAFVGNLLKDEEDTFKRRLISALAGLDDDGWDFLDQFLDSVQKKKSQE